MDMDRWAERRQRRYGRRGAPGIAAGAIIVAVGLMLLLQNMGFVRVHDLWMYWPAALIVVGIARLSEAHGPSAMIFGGLLAAVGGLLLLGNLDILHVDFNLIWPLIVIAFGLSRADGTSVYGLASDMDGRRPEKIGDGRYAVEIVFADLPLLPGSYLVRAHAMDSEAMRLFCTLERGLIVRGESREFGMVRLAHTWRTCTGAEAAQTDAAP